MIGLRRYRLAPLILVGILTLSVGASPVPAFAAPEEGLDATAALATTTEPSAPDPETPIAVVADEPFADPNSTPEKETPKKTTSNKKKRKPAVSLSGMVALQLIYDDNIIHYSEDDLSQLATELNFGKFRVVSADDMIVRPRLDLSLKSSRLTGKTLEARLRLSSWRYRDNGAKNNESYSLLLKHPGFGRDNFQLSLYHAPMAYLRNFLDRPPFTPLSTPSEYTAFSYASNTASLGYWKRWSTPISTKLELARSIRYYNRPFMENDNWEWRFGGNISWKFYKRLTAQIEYFYSDVNARAADTVGESVELSDDGDSSYQRDSYELALSLRPRGGFFKVSSISLSGQYQAYYFTTDRPYFVDPYHVGRKDQIYRTEVTARSARFFGSIVLESGYRYTERTSTAAFDSGNASIGEDKDYTNNRFWLGVEYPF